MKKCMVVMALVMLFVMQAAFAEEGEFSIRDGIKWGMTRDEVIMFEAEQLYERTYGKDYEKNGMGEEDTAEAKEEYIDKVIGRYYEYFGPGPYFFPYGSDFEELFVYDIPVSNYTAQIEHVFFRDELVACWYSIPIDEVDTDYLLAALELKYGAFDYLGEDTLLSFLSMTSAGEDVFRTGMSDMRHACLSDGTMIHYFILDNGIGTNVCILYHDTNVQWYHNTEGL